MPKVTIMDSTLPSYTPFYESGSERFVLKRTIVGGHREPYIKEKFVYTSEEFDQVSVEECCTLDLIGPHSNSAYPRHLSLEQIVSKFPGVREIVIIIDHRENFACLSLCRNLTDLTINTSAQTELQGIEYASSVKRLTVETMAESPWDNLSEPLTLDLLDGMMLESLEIWEGFRPIRAGSISLPCLGRLSLDFSPGIADAIREIEIPTSCDICYSGNEWWRKEARSARREIEQLFPSNRHIDEQ